MFTIVSISHVHKQIHWYISLCVYMYAQIYLHARAYLCRYNIYICVCVCNNLYIRTCTIYEIDSTRETLARCPVPSLWQSKRIRRHSFQESFSSTKLLLLVLLSVPKNIPTYPNFLERWLSPMTFGRTALTAVTAWSLPCEKRTSDQATCHCIIGDMKRARLRIALTRKAS